MAEGKDSAEQAGQHVNHEAVLTGVVSLANTFSICVEAFGLVHPGSKWERQEQILLAGLGVQQARLLIWGDVVGVSSPPASVTDRAIPKHPSAAYPDLKEPTFFGPRDSRLDEPEIRQQIDHALSAIVDRSAYSSREEMMEKYGLRPPKKFSTDHPPTLDTNRLEAFRERYELLKEVAEEYAHLSTRRNSSITSSSWSILDQHKFGSFIKLTQEKVDFLINLMGAKDRVDRAMCMDIRALGWHLSADRARVALDVSKLRMIHESCKDEYPEYLDATKQALDNIDRERRENAAEYNPYTEAQYAPVHNPNRFAPSPRADRAVPRGGRGSISASSGLTMANGEANGATPGKERKGSLFGSLFKRKSATSIDKGRSLSVADASSGDPPRAMSDIGPMRPASQDRALDAEEPMQGSIRSKSVGDILDAPINTEEEEITRMKLEQLRTSATVEETPDPNERLISSISAHDQYHGLGRQQTKTQYD